ncbi:MAG: hypothetical protein IPJ65_21370 [Archangiaceae bacterium]|nr:hypothetical protein [Archangiaceae bacterium]
MRKLLVFSVALAVWLCSVHVFFSADPQSLITPLAHGQLDADRSALRATNPEWDLMARMFATLAFANLSLGDPGYLPAVRRLADETERLEREHGPTWFLLPYGRTATRSLFVDGEIGLMLAARQVVAGGDPAALKARVAALEQQFAEAPLALPESYPDEGWTFCNTVALAALTVSDAALGTDHSALTARWLASARANLVDPKSGMLVTSFHRGGAHRDGPEGSTLWLSAHILQLLDPALAAGQYALARQHLRHHALGFGWAAEWPRAWQGPADIDSGPSIPLLDANAGSSGLALLGAAAFSDQTYHRELVRSLELAAFPVRRDGALRYSAGNALADSVVLYSLVQGPLWACVKGGRPCPGSRS